MDRHIVPNDLDLLKFGLGCPVEVETGLLLFKLDFETFDADFLDNVEPMSIERLRLRRNSSFIFPVYIMFEILE